MNILVKTTGGGIFSLFTIAVQSVYNEIKDINNIENIYIEVDASRYTYMNYLNGVKNETGNPFDYVLDQVKIEPCHVINASPSKIHLDHKLLYQTEEFVKLQAICSKIKIKEKVLSKINPDICAETLGVHVRLTDMLEFHLDAHKGGDTNQYINSIKNILAENKIKNIFVASDNTYSLDLLKQHYDFINNNVSNINKTQHGGNYFQYQLNNLHTEDFWVDSFVDMLSLSRCGILLNKLSNLNNTSLFFSKSLSKFYKI